EVHVHATRFQHPGCLLQIRVEMIERVLFGPAGIFPQFVRVREIAKKSRGAAEDLLATRVEDGGANVGIEPAGVIVDGLHSHGGFGAVLQPCCNAAASTCTACRTRMGWLAFSARPRRCIRQLMSADTTWSGCWARRRSILIRPIAVEMNGNVTANVPPNPQHWSRSVTSIRRTPAIEPSRISNASPVPV